MSKPRILIVEDEIVWQNELQAIITNAGYDCDSASTLDVASKKIVAIDYAVIVIDLNLAPDSSSFGGYDLLSGINFLEEIRFRDCKAIVVSAYGSTEMIRKANECGAHRFILKRRFSPEELLTHIETIVNEWTKKDLRNKKQELTKSEQDQYEQLITGLIKKKGKLFWDQILHPKLNSEALAQFVKDLYFSYQESFVWENYYGYKLHVIKRMDTIIEVTIAITASSAVASWALWKQGIGAVAWTILGGLVAILAVIKSVLQFSKQIERYTRLFIGFNSAHHTLGKLVHDIGITKEVTPTIEIIYALIMENIKQLSYEQDPIPNAKLLEKYRREAESAPKFKELWRPKQKKRL